jgi:hypothetical protein
MCIEEARVSAISVKFSAWHKSIAVFPDVLVNEASAP